METVSAKEHYDLLIQEGNDPVNDPPVIRDYMNQWDGRPFIEALALTAKSNVLEIGIGTGRLAKQVLKEGCSHLTGIDLSPATIERAKSNLRLWDNVSFIEGDFLTHPFQQTFDIIYCSLTLFHIQNKKAAFAKVAKLLAANGSYVLSIPKIKEDSIGFGTRNVMLYPDDLDETKDLLLSSGLRILKVFDTDFAHVIIAQKK